MEKRGEFVIDMSTNWLYILIIFVVIVISLILLKDKIAGYIDAIRNILIRR